MGVADLLSLYGATLLLILQYFKSHAKPDPWHVKVTVGTLGMLVTLVSAFVSFQIYDMLITRPRKMDMVLADEIGFYTIGEYVCESVRYHRHGSDFQPIDDILLVRPSSFCIASVENQPLVPNRLIPLLAMCYLYVISTVSVLTAREGLRQEEDPTIQLPNLTSTISPPNIIPHSDEENITSDHTLSAVPSAGSRGTQTGFDIRMSTDDYACRRSA
ncbi:hypothetical protein D9613_004694 [Agrocybe pediades]|uniref:Uncharacterized protein n=1 Tax=Agrocybe pediades TaxID=84607 RepID=A0A8H4R0K6_9AGAR|nr:hypothetical protein D9613_004694 [Agrocybe pediades]